MSYGSSPDSEIGLQHAIAFTAGNLPEIVSGKALVYLTIVDLWHTINNTTLFRWREWNGKRSKESEPTVANPVTNPINSFTYINLVRCNRKLRKFGESI